MIQYIQGITFINTVVTIGLFLGLTLGSFLVFKKSYKHKANLFLGLILFYYTLFLLPPYLYGARLLEFFPHVIRLGAVLAFVAGPLILFYVLACTQEKFEMRPWLWLHFIPFAFSLFYDIPFLLSSGAEKYAIFLNFVEHGTYGRPPLEGILKVIYQFIYFVLALSVILRYRKHINTTSSSIDQAYHRWLIFFSATLLFPTIALFLIAFANYDYIPITVLMVTLLLFIFGVYVALLFKPEIFQAFPNQMEVTTEEEEEKRKYESSNLQDGQKEKMVQKLLQYVETENPYQEAELTLAELSKRVNIPTHYLSQIINEKINQSFLEFINSYRVEAAKKMLASDKYEHYTIIAVAFEAGFNSKTAFYTAFKKFTDTTPSKYRKSFTNSSLGKVSA